MSFELQGATIVDRLVSISPVEDYVPQHDLQVRASSTAREFLLQVHLVLMMISDNPAGSEGGGQFSEHCSY